MVQCNHRQGKRTTQKNSKKVLTNSQSCVILKIQTKEKEKRKMLEFTFEHKHCKCLRKGIGKNVAEAYRNAKITVEGYEVWKPINIVEFN